MSLQHSPGIVTNGLVFNMDAANLKSYKGPAITNKMTSLSGANTSGTGISIISGTTTVDIPGLGLTPVVTTDIQNNYPAVSTNCCPNTAIYSPFTATPSTMYTYGLVYKTDSGYTHPNFMYRYEYVSNGGAPVTQAGVHNDTNRVHLGNGWYYAWGTFTTAATTTWITGCAAFYYRSSAYYDKMQVAKVMIAQDDWSGMHPKYWPALATTRANTDVLYDMTRNSTITATSVTYGAAGGFSFNGTTNYITGTAPFSSALPSYSIAMWIKMNSTAAEQRFYSNSGHGTMCLRYTSTQKFSFHYNSFSGSPASDVTASPSTYAPSVWRYVVATNSAANGAKCYVDGVLEGSGQRAANLAASTFLLGAANGNVLNANCVIDSTKIYNVELTAAEIKQNFNALRGRYGV